MYAMDARMYDPAIARWVVQDPVIHESLSPYNAFDNNPVFWADPSGANAVYNWDTGKYMDGDKEVSFETAMGQQGLNVDGSKKSETPPDDITVNSSGKVTKIVENSNPNRFFDESGKELFFNDANGLDKSMLTGYFMLGDQIFFNISKSELNGYIIKGGLEPFVYNMLFSKNQGLQNKFLAFYYTAINSHDTTKADFAHSVLSGFDFEKIKSPNSYTGFNETSAYFRFGTQSTMYNWFDAGNFMWGNWMKFSQFSYQEARIGSQANERFDDSPADQRAIKNGFNY
jgi:hypothetical protein